MFNSLRKNVCKTKISSLREKKTCKNQNHLNLKLLIFYESQYLVFLFATPQPTVALNTLQGMPPTLEYQCPLGN